MFGKTFFFEIFIFLKKSFAEFKSFSLDFKLLTSFFFNLYSLISELFIYLKDFKNW